MKVIGITSTPNRDLTMELTLSSKFRFAPSALRRRMFCIYDDFEQKERTAKPRAFLLPRNASYGLIHDGIILTNGHNPIPSYGHDSSQLSTGGVVVHMHDGYYLVPMHAFEHIEKDQFCFCGSSDVTIVYKLLKTGNTFIELYPVRIIRGLRHLDQKESVQWLNIRNMKGSLTTNSKVLLKTFQSFGGQNDKR